MFKSNDLLERFLANVTEASKLSKGTSNPILVLVFGHGTQAYSILVGGAGAHDSCPLLTRNKLTEAILRHNPDPNVAFLTTCCYGGGWVQSTFMNISVLSGTTADEVLLAWGTSDSPGRSCGSRYASGVARALIKREIPDFTFANEEGDEVLRSGTFAALVKIIHDTLVKEIDVWESNRISFLAKDDL